MARWYVWRYEIYAESKAEAEMRLEELIANEGVGPVRIILDAEEEED